MPERRYSADADRMPAAARVDRDGYMHSGRTRLIPFWSMKKGF